MASFCTVFVGRCPLGDQCSKKHGILAKKRTEEEVRDAIKWHLEKSPYHELSEEEAASQAAMAEVESLEEEAHHVAASEADEGDEWYANRKRQRRGNDDRVQAAAFRLLQQQGLGGSSGSAAPGPSVLSLRTPGGRGDPHQKVVLTKVQLQACVDSLKRAKTAAESACHLCSKASRAFGEEAACIQSCQEVLESYLP